MKYGILTLMLFVVMLTGCQDEGELRLNFVGTFGQEPLVLGEDLVYLPEYEISILESDFFISEIALTNGSEVTRIHDIDFIEFSRNNFTLEDAIAGINLDYAEIPGGTYDGVRFGIGVPPSQNGMNPADFESSNPLSKPGFHWPAWESFIFSKFGGKIGDDGFFFHTGTDELFRTFEISKQIVISKDNREEIKIILDHKELLMENGNLFDILNSPVNHDPLAPGPLEMLVNNYSSAFSIE